MASPKGKKTTTRRKSVTPQKAKPVQVKAAPAAVSQTDFLGLMLSWGLVFLALLSLPNAQLLVPGWRFFSGLPFYPLLILGFAGMVYFFRRIPEAGTTEDIRSQWARPIFFLLLVLGAFIRLQQINRISGCIDNDHWMCADEALKIMEEGDRPILLPYGQREPFFAYLSAAIWSLNPQATANVALTLSSVLVDVFILWSFYLLGKEFGGRRGGLIFMGMGMMSKTLVEISKINFGFHTDVLACALTVLFLFRLLKNPKLARFLHWGLALTLGSYVYVAFRLWTPAISGGLWLWMFWNPELRPKTRIGFSLAFAVMGGWTFAFFYVNRVIPHEWGWVHFLSSGWGLLALVAGLLFLYIRSGMESRGKDWVFKWASGALLVALLLSPLWSQPNYSDHPNEMVIFHPRFEMTKMQCILYCLDNFWNGFKLLFSYDNNNPFWNIPPMHGDSYMDFFIPLFGSAALAAYLARPRLVQSSILCLWFIGYAAFFVTHGAHSNRLMATLLPMFLIAAWGAYRLWQVFRFSTLKNGKAWGNGLLLAVGLWSLVTNVQILQDWMNMRWPDAFVQDVIDVLPQDRVYLVPSVGHFGESAWDLVSEGKDVHLALDSNPIDLVEGDKGKDVVVILWGGDDAMKAKLTQAFPGGSWSEKDSAWPVTSLKWITIPFSQIPQDPKAYRSEERRVGKE